MMAKRKTPDKVQGIEPSVTELDVLITIVESLNVIIRRLNDLCDAVSQSNAGTPSQHGRD